MRRSNVFALVGAALLLSATSAMAAGVDGAEQHVYEQPSAADSERFKPMGTAPA